jgi:cellulose synthase/poly-beta-1,6-N-acetylglucosamine synthase-like glycosyltransferase
MRDSALANDLLVTVIVPARNEAINIERCLDSIARQEYRPIEVVVVDGMSSDGTAQAVENVAKNLDLAVRVIPNIRRTIPHALNLGAAAATGEVVVRLDAHAELAPGYLTYCVDRLRTGEWAGVGGRKEANASTVFGKAAAVAFQSRLGSGDSYYHYGTEPRSVEHVPFGAYPAYIVRALGGWNERCLVNQDYEFDHRLGIAGGRLLFDPALILRWRGRENPSALAYQYFRYGRGKALVAIMHPSSLRPRQLAAPAVVVAGLLGALTSVFTRRLTATALVAVPYLGLLIVGAASARRQGEPREIWLRVPAALACMHLPWGLGFLVGLARSQHPDPFLSNPGERSLG